jgi:hypothetical protein
MYDLLLEVYVELAYNAQSIRDEEITIDWNYDASCTLTSLPVSDLQKF